MPLRFGRPKRNLPPPAMATMYVSGEKPRITNNRAILQAVTDEALAALRQRDWQVTDEVPIPTEDSPGGLVAAQRGGVPRRSGWLLVSGDRVVGDDPNNFPERSSIYLAHDDYGNGEFWLAGTAAGHNFARRTDIEAMARASYWVVYTAVNALHALAQRATQSLDEIDG